MDARQDDGFSTTIRLVRSAKEGDRGALDQLFRRYLPVVERIVSLRMGLRLRQFLDLEDMVQEALLKVFRGLERFEERSEGTFRNWLSRCVECEIRDQARAAGAAKRGRQKVRRLSEEEEGSLYASIFADPGPSPSAVARGRELMEKVEEALLALPEEYREVLILRSLCGMSYADLAEALGFRQEATARKACSRATAKLREALGV